MPWTKLYIKKVLNRDGRAGVYLTVNVKNKRLRLGTTVNVLPSDWNAQRQEVRRTEPLYSQLNSALNERVSQVEKAIADVLHGTDGKILRCTHYKSRY